MNITAVKFMQQKYDECEELCNKVIKMVRDQKSQGDLKFLAKAYNRLASIQEKKGNLEKALELYKESSLEYSDPKIKDKVKAVQKMLKKKVAEAYLDPVKAEEARQRGNGFFKESKWPEAVKEYTEAIK